MHTLMDILVRMDSAEDIPIIEARIDHLVRRYIASDGLSAIPDPCGQVMDAVAGQALISNQGGKRLRALLTLAAYDAAISARQGKDATFTSASSQRDLVMDVACAIEVFQTGALVHDDIIDDSDLRRGKPSAHVALSLGIIDDKASSSVSRTASPTDMADSSAPADGNHLAFGKGLGIMLGDILATASISIAQQACEGLSTPVPPHSTATADSRPRAVDPMNAFLSMHREVEIGQVLDLGVEHVPLDDPERLAEASLSVFRWKTASYTTIAPIELGLLAAGIEAGSARATALRIGLTLGVAFQLADDLLDVVSDSDHTGKPIGGDIREGKRTVLLADALSEASEQDRALLTTIYERDDRSPEEVNRTIEIFHRTGAIDKSRRRITALWHRTLDALTEASTALGLDSTANAALHDACALFIPYELRKP